MNAPSRAGSDDRIDMDWVMDALEPGMDPRNGQGRLVADRIPRPSAVVATQSSVSSKVESRPTERLEPSDGSERCWGAEASGSVANCVRGFKPGKAVHTALPTPPIPIAHLRPPSHARAGVEKSHGIAPAMRLRCRSPSFPIAHRHPTAPSRHTVQTATLCPLNPQRSLPRAQRSLPRRHSTFVAPTADRVLCCLQHFKNKFCPNCINGFDLPLARVRALPPSLTSFISNTNSRWRGRRWARRWWRRRWVGVRGAVARAVEVAREEVAAARATAARATAARGGGMAAAAGLVARGDASLIGRLPNMEMPP